MENAVNAALAKTVLEKVFLETYALYFKAHSYHWNVKSSNFHSDHAFLEGQYDSLWESLDEIAERFRALDLPAPSSAPSVSALAFGASKDAMYADLLSGHEGVISTLRSGIETLEAA